jgi:hypothetical protein
VKSPARVRIALFVSLFTTSRQFGIYQESRQLTGFANNVPLRRALADLNRQFLEPRIATLHALFLGTEATPEFSLDEFAAVEWIARCRSTLIALL